MTSEPDKRLKEAKTVLVCAPWGFRDPEYVGGVTKTTCAQCPAELVTSRLNLARAELDGYPVIILCAICAMKLYQEDENAQLMGMIRKGMTETDAKKGAA